MDVFKARLGKQVSIPGPSLARSHWVLATAPLCEVCKQNFNSQALKLRKEIEVTCALACNMSTGLLSSYHCSWRFLHFSSENAHLLN